MNLSPASLVCPKCGKECTSITIKFKVHMRVQDETGNVSFVMFDKDVMKLIGSTANDIRERQLKLDDTETFPHEISRIQKVCDDPDIIAELVGGNGNALEVADEVFSQEGSEIKAVQLSESSQMADADISKDVEGQNVGELSSNNKRSRWKPSRLNT
ncbi:putative nucleic acid-binding protein [Helianthus debilis subsp. tardiflorus]